MSDNRIIDGKAFAACLRERVAVETDRLKADHGIVPGLAALLVGQDPASQVYVRNKNRQMVEAGMLSLGETLPEDTTQADLLAVIDKLNANPAVNGILVQLPLPSQIDPNSVIDAIDPAKDVDGVPPAQCWPVGHRARRHGALHPTGLPNAAEDRLGDLTGLNAVIVGRSNIVGKPMAQLLLDANCTVTVAHSRTDDLPGVCREADILVVAVGEPQMIKGDWIKPGGTVIDVGINRVPGREDGKTRLVGDVDFEAAVEYAGAITPVPGGVGPMTIACLLRNTLVAACRQNGVEILGI